MRKLIYSMGVSLDGFIAGPQGEIDWAAPDEELPLAPHYPRRPPPRVYRPAAS